MKKEEMFFCFGTLSLLLLLIVGVEDISLFLFFLIISFLCFVNCRRLLMKIFCKSIIIKKAKLIKEKWKLEKEVDLLIRKKNTLELFISDNDKYVNEIIDYGDKVEKLKKIKQNVQILECKKENLEEFMKQEEVITKKIKDKKQKNEELEEQNENLKNEIATLQVQIKPMKKTAEFSKKISLEYVDGLDGFEFENFTNELLCYLGFDKSIKTKSSGDYGIDVIAERDGVKYGIQCKNYSQTVGNKAIQEAYSGKSYYNCHVAVVMTNNYFTDSAKKQAEKNGVVLWDRNKLKEFIETIT